MKSILLAVALAVVVLPIYSQPAQCNHCLSSFCGSSSECPGPCVCAIPMGKATGRCVNTR